MVCILIIAMMPLSVFADVGEPEPTISITGTSAGPDGLCIFDCDDHYSSGYIYAYYTTTDTDNRPEYQVTSSDPAVVQISNQYIDHDYDGTGTVGVWVNCAKAGRSDISFVICDQQVTVPVVVLPYAYDLINSVALDSYEKVKVRWRTCSGISGYQIQRSLTGKNNFKTIASFSSSTTKGIVSARTGKKYEYRVIPFIKVGNKEVTLAWKDYEGYKNFWSETVTYKAELPITSMESITAKNSTLTLSWKKAKGATSYVIYHSNCDNGTYKKVATVKNKTTWSHKVSKGETHCYKVVPIFPNDKGNASNSLSYFIPKSGKSAAKTISDLDDYIYGAGQYSYSNTASPDTTYLYTVGSKRYIVCLTSNEKSLKIYSLNSSDKITSTKTIKLPKNYDRFGGFYHGEDGRFYVAVGYDNLKESKKKKVIEVIQYDKNWKKMKTAVIKGGASNYYEGIYEPFRAANVSFAMYGKTLYMFTGRTMFVHSDGLHHQSNISFAINTSTMKASEANESYSSHSFNQCARFKDDSLYLMDHGDAYPRSVQITMADGYSKKNTIVSDYEVFKFKGEIGENFTGCYLAGMEVGSKNVLTVGTSQPHYFKVGGKKGMKTSWEENLFVAVTNRKTGKTSVKWLTEYKPNRSDDLLSEARLVKLSDYRFAILISIDDKLNYFAIDRSGKVIKHKKYSKVPFTASVQPVLHDGKLIWVENIYDYDKGTEKTKLCSIPAL